MDAEAEAEAAHEAEIAQHAERAADEEAERAEGVDAMEPRLAARTSPADNQMIADKIADDEEERVMAESAAESVQSAS